MAFDRERMKSLAASLAAQGVFIGTSSWKYAGWCGMLYNRSRYTYRDKFAESRFEKQCLAEYAEVFKTVCVDAAYYRFPEPRYLEGLASQVEGKALQTIAAMLGEATVEAEDQSGGNFSPPASDRHRQERMTWLAGLKQLKGAQPFEPFTIRLKAGRDIVIEDPAVLSIPSSPDSYLVVDEGSSRHIVPVGEIAWARTR